MKKYLSLIILLFFTKSYSQEYVPLLKEGNKWYELREEYNFDMPSPNYYTYIYINGEETKNGIVYKRLLSNLYCYSFDRPFPCSSTGNGDEFYKLIRENIAERKVYFYDEVTNSDILLYDFSLNVGDQLPSNFPFNPQNSNYNPNEFSVKSIIDNGKVFNTIIPKTYITDEVFNNYSYNSKIYEGIGSNSGLLNRPGHPIFEGGNRLICFENTAYGKSCESDFLSTNEYIKNNSSSLLYLKDKKLFRLTGKSSENFKIEFFDFNGRLLETRNGQFNTEFTLQNFLRTGVYLYKINFKSNFVTGRIIIP